MKQVAPGCEAGKVSHVGGQNFDCKNKIAFLNFLGVKMTFLHTNKTTHLPIFGSQYTKVRGGGRAWRKKRLGSSDLL